MAGLLNATAVLDIDAAGNLGGKINAEVKSPTAVVRGALSITGKVPDPQIRK